MWTKTQSLASSSACPHSVLGKCARGQRMVRRVGTVPRLTASTDRHSDGLSSSMQQVVVISAPPQTPSISPPLEEADPLHSKRLADEYERGYKAGLAAAAAAAQESGAKAPPPADSVLRTAVKSLTWRVLSTGTTIFLALVMFQDSIAADAAVELGVVEFISKYGLYFIHERLWTAIAFVL